MTDLRRWVDDGAPGNVRELLVAASEEQPQAAGAQRTLVALGVGGTVVTGAAHAAGVIGGTAAAKGATSAGALAILVKWGLIGAVGALSTLGVFSVLRPPAGEGSLTSPGVAKGAPVPVSQVERLTPERAHEALPAPPTAISSAPLAAVGAPRLTPTAASAGTPPPSSTKPRDDSARMLEEVSSIDRARSALARGDARGTLEAVQAYESTFAERRFEPEAQYLRMEALGRLGDRAGERAVAERLVKGFSNAPQAARARAVLSGAAH